MQPTVSLYRYNLSNLCNEPENELNIDTLDISAVPVLSVLNKQACGFLLRW
jgi:hypothetical protein